MNAISFLSALAVSVYVFLALYTVRQTGPRTPAKWVFAGFCFLYAAWSVMYAFLSSAKTKEEAWMWTHIFAFAWTISASVFLHFSLLFTRKITAKNWMVPLLVYLPGVVFAVKGTIGPLFFDDFVRQHGAWVEVTTHPSIWPLLYMLYYYVFIVTGLLFIGVWAKNSLFYKHKQQAKIIVAGYAVTVLLIIFQNHIQGLFGISAPHVPHLLTIIWMIAIWYAMTRYEFLGSISIETARNPLWRRFTKREHEIIVLLMQGYGYREIGDRLFISYYTVKSHVEHIYSKAGVNNKAQLLFNLRIVEATPVDNLN